MRSFGVFAPGSHLVAMTSLSRKRGESRSALPMVASLPP